MSCGSEEGSENSVHLLWQEVNRSHIQACWRQSEPQEHLPTAHTLTHTHSHSYYSQWCTHAMINTHSNHAPYQSTFTKLQTLNSVTQWTLHNPRVRDFIDPYTHRTLTQTHTHLRINIDYQRTRFFFFNDMNSCISDLTPTFSEACTFLTKRARRKISACFSTRRKNFTIVVELSDARFQFYFDVISEPSWFFM